MPAFLPSSVLYVDWWYRDEKRSIETKRVVVKWKVEKQCGRFFPPFSCRMQFPIFRCSKSRLRAYNCLPQVAQLVHRQSIAKSSPPQRNKRWRLITPFVMKSNLLFLLIERGDTGLNACLRVEGTWSLCLFRGALAVQWFPVGVDLFSHGQFVYRVRSDYADAAHGHGRRFVVWRGVICWCVCPRWLVAARLSRALGCVEKTSK